MLISIVLYLFFKLWIYFFDFLLVIYLELKFLVVNLLFKVIVYFMVINGFLVVI